jgi:hypothetical protein
MGAVGMKTMAQTANNISMKNDRDNCNDKNENTIKPKTRNRNAFSHFGSDEEFFKLCMMPPHPKTEHPSF